MGASSQTIPSTTVPHRPARSITPSQARRMQTSVDAARVRTPSACAHASPPKVLLVFSLISRSRMHRQWQATHTC